MPNCRHPHLLVGWLLDRKADAAGMNSSVTTSVHAHSAGRLDVPAIAYRGSLLQRLSVDISMHTAHKTCMWPQTCVQHVSVTCIAPIVHECRLSHGLSTALLLKRFRYCLTLGAGLSQDVLHQRLQQLLKQPTQGYARILSQG
jgi:hypothetical protein